MSLRKVVVLVVVGVVAFVVLSTVAVYLLWSSGEDAPTRRGTAEILRQ